MTDTTRAEKWFEGLIKNKDLVHSLGLMRQAVWRLWKEEKVIQDFTLHDLDHSLRVAEFTQRMLAPGCFKGDKLTSDEAYVLLAAIYLHDIGNQCVEPNVLSLPEFNIPLPPRQPTSQLPLEIQSDIRDKHHLIGGEWIRYLYRRESSEPNSLWNAVRSIPTHLVEPIIDVCKYHSRENITECEPTFDIDDRRLFLAVLLRLADELDITRERVVLDTVKNFQLAPQNEMYWWMHHLTLVKIDKTGQIAFRLTIHKDDFQEAGQELKTLVIDKFTKKNKLLISLLWGIGVHLHLDEDPEHLFQINTVQDRLPPNIKEKIKEEAQKWLRADLLERGEIRAGLSEQNKRGRCHKSVLVVEDVPSMLEWLVGHIAAETPDYEIEIAAASNFSTALESLKRQTPDLLVTDIDLGTPPRGLLIADIDSQTAQSGFDLISKLPPSVPVIVITGLEEIPTDQISKLTGQVKACIRKRKLPEKLNAAIAAALGTPD